MAAGEVEISGLLAKGRALLRDAVARNPSQNTTGLVRPRHFVYGRFRRPFLRCGTAVAFVPAERSPHGRETWWCRNCQT